MCLFSYAFVYRPQADFSGIYRWLVKIYGCFLAKLENCVDRIFWLKIQAVYEIYSCFSAKSKNTEAIKCS